MTEKYPDRRVRRTRRALQNALIDLILEKGYDSVTIEEITDQADLGRTTFYLHFKDKDELFMQAVDTIFEDFIEKHEQRWISKEDTPSQDIFSAQLRLDGDLLYHIFLHARENADLYKVIFRGEGSAKAMQRFEDISKNEFTKRLNNLPGLEYKVPTEVFAVFFSGTIIQLATWWLEKDQPYAIEDMVRYFQQMFFYGALDTVNLPSNS
jgi:AcrR family transcriptional regulator